MLSDALREARTHLVRAATALGPHVVKQDHVDGNILIALESIDRAICSVILSVPSTQYDTTALQSVMDTWVNTPPKK